uniref:TRAF3-interacting protein 1 n=1 Tax=Ascaris lumbricoides TaxID=6252 RepID=A0A9J2PAX9_ASCLU
MALEEKLKLHLGLKDMHLLRKKPQTLCEGSNEGHVTRVLPWLRNDALKPVRYFIHCIHALPIAHLHRDLSGHLFMDTDKTRQLFASLIQRPPLTDHLLQRPPFKFLHDVINATIQNTGFLFDIFTPEELDYSNMKDKATKMEFLQKLIKALNDDGSLKSVKAAKIVAGKEPELTNALLQKLAVEAAAYRDRTSQSQSKTSSGPIVKERDAGEKVEKRERKSKQQGKKEKSEKSEKTKERSSSRDQEKKAYEGKEKRHSSKDKKTSNEKSKKKKEKGGESEKENYNKSPSQRNSIDEGHFEDGEVEVLMRDEEAVHADEEPSGTAKTEDSGIADDLGNEGESMPLPPAQRQQNRLVKEHFQLTTASGRPQTSMGRPGTAMARPAPPKLKKKQIAEVERKVEPVAETSTVIVDERKEDDEDFVVETDPTIENVERVDADLLVSDEHGGLVRTILETKKGLEAGIDEDATKFLSTSVFDENEREKTKKEVDKMQKAIQQLTQTTHPLARLFDYVQEDVDSMVKEMDEWRNETKKNTVELRERNANSVDSAERLLMTLKELEDEIKDMRVAVARTKANIIVNEQKIRTLIQNL